MASLVHLSQARLRLAIISARRHRQAAETCYVEARALLDEGRIPAWQRKLREFKELDDVARDAERVVRDLEDRQRAAALAKLLDAAAGLGAA